MNNQNPVVRVRTYVDGSNLYFGMKDAALRHCYWLNLELLVAKLLGPTQQSVGIKYFTSMISGPEPKRRRQLTWIEAVETLASVEIIKGQFRDAPKSCPLCHRQYLEPGEKMTDVNIAVQMLLDATQDEFDTALLISGDSDLVPPVKAIRALYPQKRIVAVFPPHRVSSEQKRAASAHLTLWPDILEKSRFPATVTRADGFVLQSPWPLEKSR